MAFSTTKSLTSKQFYTCLPIMRSVMEAGRDIAKCEVYFRLTTVTFFYGTVIVVNKNDATASKTTFIYDSYQSFFDAHNGGSIKNLRDIVARVKEAFADKKD